MVEVGRIVKPHGVKGEVGVLPSTDDPKRFESGSEVFVGTDPSTTKALRIVRASKHKAGLIVSFEGVTDREAASEISGRTIFGEPDPDLELAEGDFLVSELIGMRVVDRSGRELGELVAVQKREIQDLWDVKTSEGTVSVPAAKDVITSVDLSTRIIEMDPPKGLFSL